MVGIALLMMATSLAQQRASRSRTTGSVAWRSTSTSSPASNDVSGYGMVATLGDARRPYLRPVVRRAMASPRHATYPTADEGHRAFASVGLSRDWETSGLARHPWLATRPFYRSPLAARLAVLDGVPEVSGA